MKHQFLLTWIVLFGAVGVYSQLQQHEELDISDEGLDENYIRVPRGGYYSEKSKFRTVYKKPSGTPAPAHGSSTASQASRAVTRQEINRLKGEVEQLKAQGQSSVLTYAGQQPAPAHGSSTASQGSKNAAFARNGMARGSKEYDTRQMSRANFQPLANTLSQQQNRAAVKVH